MRVQKMAGLAALENEQRKCPEDTAFHGIELREV